MPSRQKILLGQLLVEQGLITLQQLEVALSDQKKTGHLLGLTLIRMGFIDQEQVFLPVLAKQLGLDYLRLKEFKPDAESLGRLPAKAANYYKVLPLKLENGQLIMAMHNPLDVQTLDDLVLLTKTKIIPVLASVKDIQEAIRNFYGVGAETIERMMSDAAPAAEAQVTESIDEASSEASISRFLNQILLQAHRDKATDIHIDPFEDELRIRYRIDGMLYDAKVPENIRYFQDSLIARIKVLSNLNIAEKRLPQDGRFSVRVDGADLDLRVSFLPSIFGESCVVRLLNVFQLYNFEQLGITGAERGYLDVLLEKPHGIVFLTGPTGSGKTTTLYSCLAAVNDGNSKIITVEDPVEYQLKGVVQIQAKPQIGLTFASALRSMLRNDPDIIMVGEVRDFETAQISIQMSLTGHLVFSTLHTNDAASGITRLMDIGIEPYLIASSVECFIAQRLVRLLCPHCKQSTLLTEAIKKQFDLVSLKQTGGRLPVVYEAKGCEHCRMTGYSGRQAICEFLMVTDAVRAMIVRRATNTEIKKHAVDSGMKTLRQHGWEKVAAGLTSPSEVLRVTEETE